MHVSSQKEIQLVLAANLNQSEKYYKEIQRREITCAEQLPKWLTEGRKLQIYNTTKKITIDAGSAHHDP